MSKVRVRFAPSPTGPLHIGGVRTALYNYLSAKKRGGKLVLRIEDTDQTRLVNGAEKYIINSLNWCGINFDESVVDGGDFGPYKQSERRLIYQPYAEQLVKDGYAYYAFDTKEELSAMRERMQKAGVLSPQYNNVTRNTMKNSLSLSEDEVKKLPTVCGSLREAMQNLDKDRKFLTEGGVFTDDQIDAYIELKFQEIYNFEHTPHPIEFEMYYSG